MRQCLQGESKVAVNQVCVGTSKTTYILFFLLLKLWWFNCAYLLPWTFGPCNSFDQVMFAMVSCTLSRLCLCCRCDTAAHFHYFIINHLQRQGHAVTNANKHLVYNLKAELPPKPLLVRLVAWPGKCLVLHFWSHFFCLHAPTDCKRQQAPSQFSSCHCLQKETPHYCRCTLNNFLNASCHQLARLIKRLHLLQPAAELTRWAADKAVNGS